MNGYSLWKSGARKKQIQRFKELPLYQENFTHKVINKDLHLRTGYNVLGAYKGAKGPLMG